MTVVAGGSARALTLGTAGHIDHGKTTLIKALTGKDTDRLKEEKERGISIELGFAELELPEGRRLSVVDVPGHERFVKNMVSGATGIDLFLLVVAADDGVMPQTREHLRIIELLEIPAGVVALTKTDMVDPDMVELASADVEDFLAETRYEGTAVVPVSGVTGSGLQELREALEVAAAWVPPRPAYPATRLAVDRVFSLKGIGTVVTGTLWSGELRPEDVVAVLPRASSGRELAEVRIRSIQVHDRQVDMAYGGQRVALNLTGVERQEVQRGRWIVKNPAVAPTFLADVSVQLLAESPAALERVSRVRVDHGTAELLAKLILADRETLEPGESAYGQLRFEERALLYPGDHLILRSITPVTTIGGGRVFDPAPHKHGTDPKWRSRLAVLENGPAEDIAELLLQETFPRGIVRRTLERSPYLWRFHGRTAVEALLAEARAETGEGEVLYHAAALGALRRKVMEAVKARAEQDAANPFLTLGELRKAVSGGREWPALDAALAQLQAAGEVVRSEHGVRWGEAAAALEGADAEAAERLVAAMTAGGADVPTPTVATQAAGLRPEDGARLLKALERQGRVVRVGEDLYYPVEVLQSLLARISSTIEEEGQITLAQVRDLLGTSRRYAQALLEHMDSEGLTLRVGDARRLRRRRR